MEVLEGEQPTASDKLLIKMPGNKIGAVQASGGSELGHCNDGSSLWGGGTSRRATETANTRNGCGNSGKKLGNQIANICTIKRNQTRKTGNTTLPIPKARATPSGGKSGSPNGVRLGGPRRPTGDPQRETDDKSNEGEAIRLGPKQTCLEGLSAV